MNTKTMFSTGNNDMSTPQDIFDKLNNVFNFTLDPCADINNHKCDLYYTKEDNGLSKSWAGHVVFCNPPYSRKTKSECGQEDFIQKCKYEYVHNHVTCVMLIPARTDTKAQHKYIFPFAKYICFLSERLKFSNQSNYAPFPSEIVVFTDKNIDQDVKNLKDIGFWIKLRQ